ESHRLVGPQQGRGRERARSEDPQRARRDREDLVDGDLRLGPAPLRRLHPGDAQGRHPRPRVHGRDRRDRQGRVEPQGRRPCRGAVSDCLRLLQRVLARAVLGLRELQPQRLDGREDVRRRAMRDLRLLASHRRLRGRAGGVRAGPVRRRRADQDRQRPRGRAGAVSLRRLSDGLDGRRDVQHPARRHRRRLGLRARRAVCDRERVPAGCRAGDRDRPLRVPPEDGAREGRRGDDQLRADAGPRGAARDDRRPRARPLHRGRRHGGAPPQPRDVRLRPRQAGGADGVRARLRRARGDPQLPQRRHGLDRRHLRRLHGQVPDRRHRQQVADDQERAVPRAALPAAVAQQDRERRHRPELHRHAPDVARRRLERLRDVQAQAGRVREGRPQAM
ncbi:MAG: Threonine dehydrogenase and related Zn-dependent dehydrogenases, partial [uncultured Solirubrobacteraceae bacterium]